jgi:hypothetical protein
MKPTKPERVEVGSRWQCGDRRSTVTRLEDAARTRKVWLRYDDTEREVYSPEELFVGASPSYVYLGTTAGIGVAAPMAENKDGYPVGCLSCGAKLSEEEAYECDACDEDGYGARTDAWHAGARDFPRRAPSAATPTPARDEGRSCSTCHGVHGEPPCPPGWPKASAPKLREVSTNGKPGSWVPYSSNSGYPFDTYRHRRENGVVVMAGPPRGYNGKTWEQHVVGDQNMRVGMRQRDHENPSAGRRLTAMMAPPPRQPSKPLPVPSAHSMLWGGLFNILGGR